MILAFVGSADSAVTLSALVGAPRLDRAVRGDARVLVFASGETEAIADGVRLGRAPLPHVDVQLAGSEPSVIATRSGFGGRPLYVRNAGEPQLTCTDLGSLVRASRALGLPVTLDADALARRSAHLPALERRTIYREISEVSPGTRATGSSRGWSFARLCPPRATAMEADARELSEMLSRAVAASLPPGRVGVLTGGGLDSSALLAFAHRLAREVNAFAIDFAGDDSDRPYLAELCRRYHVSPSRVTAGEETFSLGDDAAGLPLIWPSGALETTLLARAKAWGASAVLCGAFADACFDGEPEAASHILLRQGPVRALAAARGYDGSSLPVACKRVLWPHVRRLLPAAVRSSLRAVRERKDAPPLRSFDGPRLRQARTEAWMRAQDVRPAIEDDAAARIERAFFAEDLALLAELRAQQESLAMVARADAYLSSELVTFALSLRPELLLGHGQRRALFREATRELLPSAIVERAGKASFRPLHASLLARTERGTSFTALADLGIVDAVAAREALDRARETPTQHDGELLSLLGVERWLRRGGA